MLSGGRVTAGIGVGKLRHESDALGSDYTRRGAYADEGIAIMSELWTQEDPSFRGTFFSFSGVKFSPKPAQPHLPIWVGGNSDAALRRAARLGDGWHADGLPPEELGRRKKYLKAQVAAAGRDMSEIALSVRHTLDVLESRTSEPAGPMVGTPDQLLAAIGAYDGAGVSEMVLAVVATKAERVYQVIDAFAEKVMRRAG